MKRLICLLLCVTLQSVMALPVCATSEDQLRADIIAAMAELMARTCRRS